MRTLVVGLFVLAALALVLLFVAPTREAGPVAVQGGDPEPPASANSADPGPVDSGVGVERRVVTDAAGAFGPAPRDSEIIPESRLVGTVVDAASGDGIPGALVTLLRPLVEGGPNVDLAILGRTDELGHAEADAAGRFAFEVRPGEVHSLRVEHPGHGRLLRKGCYGGGDHLLELSRAASVRGVVTVEGKAAAEVPVLISCRGRDEFRRETDARGAWSCDGLPAGVATLEFVAEHGETDRARVELVAGEELIHDIDLDLGTRTVGRVVDAETGLPIHRATLATGWMFAKITRTDAEGRYRLLGFPEDGRPILHARADGYAGASRDMRRVQPAEDGAIHADFELVPGGAVSGRVVDSSGTSIAGAYVAAMGYRVQGPGLLGADVRSSTTDARGNYRIVDLERDGAYELVVSRRGYGQRVYAFPRLLGARRELELPEVVLHPAARIRGIVQDEGGRPLEDVAVGLRGANLDRNAHATDETEGAASSFAGEREARSDGQGRFHFTDLAEGEYRLSARLDSSVTSETTLSLVVAEQRLDLEVGLFVGEELSGRLLTADGEPVEIAVGKAFRIGVQGNGEALEPVKATAQRGAFRFRGLRPGRYRVDWKPWRPTGPEFSVEAEAGATDLEFRMPDSVTISGQVVDGEGRGVPGCHVGAVYDGASGMTVGSDREGAFALQVPRNQAVELRVFVMRGSEASGVERAEFVDPAVARDVVGPRDGLILTVKD